VAGVRLEQNRAANVTPGPEVQEKETAALLANGKSHLVNTTEPAPCHIRARSRYALPQLGPTPAVRSATPRASATVSLGQAQPPGSRQVNGVESVNEPSVAWRAPQQPRRSAQVQKLSEPPVPGPVEQPQTTGEATTPVTILQELNQGSGPTQQRNSDEFHSTKAVSAEDDASRQERDTQYLFPDISWEGWGLIKTPGGVYLPETFSSSLRALEGLTDRL
jgi:hypothetical protein